MNNLEKETKRAAFILFGIGIVCLAISILSGCGQENNNEGNAVSSASVAAKMVPHKSKVNFRR